MNSVMKFEPSHEILNGVM